MWVVIGGYVTSVALLQWLLWQYRTQHSAPFGKRLVLLRAFGHARQAESLLEGLGDTWRLIGNVDLVVASDVAAFTVSPDGIEAYLQRKLETRYVRTVQAMEKRMAVLNRHLQSDGRYPIQEFYCFDSVWQDAIVRLVPGADAVLMDLRGFSETNRGCMFELSQLLRLVPLKRILLLANDSTDMRALNETLQSAWSAACEQAASINNQEPVLDILVTSTLDFPAQRFLASRLALAAGL